MADAISSASTSLQRQCLLSHPDTDDYDDDNDEVPKSKNLVSRRKKSKVNLRASPYATKERGGEVVLQRKRYDFSPIDKTGWDIVTESFSIASDKGTISLEENQNDISPQPPRSVLSSTTTTTNTSSSSSLTNIKEDNTKCLSPIITAVPLSPSMAPASPQSPPPMISSIPFFRRHRRRKDNTASSVTATRTAPEPTAVANDVNNNPGYLCRSETCDDRTDVDEKVNNSSAQSTTTTSNEGQLNQAITYAQQASQHFQQQMYHDAYRAYENAVSIYIVRLVPFIKSSSSCVAIQENQNVIEYLLENNSLPIDSDCAESSILTIDSTMITTCLNAAGCYRNMGVVARMIRQPSNVIHRHLQCAEVLYSLMLERVQQIQEQQIESSSSSISSSSTPSQDEGICVVQLLIETMQNRALCFIKYDKNVVSSISCHEKCLLLLKLHHPSIQSNKNCNKVDPVVLKSISEAKWIDLFINSLLYLCAIYRTHIPKSITTLLLFQESIVLLADEIRWDTLKIPVDPLDSNQLSRIHQQRKVIRSVIETFRTISQLYNGFSKSTKNDIAYNEAMDLAIDTLQYAIDVELQCHGLEYTDIDPSVESLHAMDNLGFVNEQSQQYDKALRCYEKVILARSQLYDEHHVDVAKSLINAARIMELQGNYEGSLDLYRAAHSIYTYQITSTHDTVFASCEDATEILQLIPNLLEQERFEEARAYLMKCLTIVDKEERSDGAESNLVVDKSRIYYDLSKAYIGLKEYVSATIYLVEAGKVKNGKVTEEDVLNLMRQVELLQRRDENRAIKKHIRDDPCDHLLHKIYSLDESIRQTRSLDNQLNCISSNIITSPSTDHSLSKLSFRPSSMSSWKQEAAEHRSTSYLQPNVVGACSSKDALESVLSGFTSLLKTDTGSSQYSTNKNVSDLSSLFNDDSNFDLAICQPSTISGLTVTLKDDTSSRHVRSKTTLSSATIPTIDLASSAEPNFRTDVFDPLNKNVRNHVPTASTIPQPWSVEESTIRFVERTNVSTISGSANSTKNHENFILTKNKSFGGMLTSPHYLSPTRGKDEASIFASHSPKFSKVFSERLRRPSRRDGFQTFFDSSPDLRNCNEYNVSEIQNDQEVTEEGSSVSPSFPLLMVDGTFAEDDDISDITMRHLINDSNMTSRESGQEWWWGITTEGIGRWFPTTYITQAVQAADAFLSAKAIHSKNTHSENESSKFVGRNVAINHSQDRNVEFHTKSGSELNEVCDVNDDLSDDISDDRKDIASHVGITSTNASRVNFLDCDGENGYATFEVDGKWIRTQSFPADLFTTPSSRHRLGYDIENDVVSETLACRELLIAQQNEYGACHPTVANTLFKLAILYSRDSDIDAAIECSNEALRIQSSIGNLPDCAQSLHFLADLYLHHMEYKLSLSHYERALHHETNYYGYISDQVAKTLNCIGTVKLLQHSFRSSMESHEQALCILNECHEDEATKTTHGRNHPLISETLCHIGNVYFRERHHQDDDKMCDRTTASFSGSKSSNTATRTIDRYMLERIAGAYEDRGSYNMAIFFLQEVSEYLESSAVDQTADILCESARIYNELGALCCTSGLYDVAKQYHERALSIHLQLECESMEIAKAHIYTGNVQYQLGNYNVALQSYRQALEYYQQEEEGDELQGNIATTLFYIGEVQSSLCQYDAAMGAFTTAYSIQQSVHGIDHYSSMRTKREIVNLNVLYCDDDIANNINDLQGMLTIQKRLYDSNHPNVAETLHCIGLAYIGQKEYTKALQILEECYFIRYKFFRNDHPIQATTLYDIAKVHVLMQNNYKKALQICDAVLRIRKMKLCEPHIDIARTYMLMGACYLGCNNNKTNKDAYQYLIDAYKMTIQCLHGVEQHVVIAEIYSELSVYYLLDCQFDMAVSYIHRVLSIYKKLRLGPNYYGTIYAQRILHRIEKDEMLCV